MLLMSYLHYTLTIWLWWFGHFALIYGLGLLVSRVFKVRTSTSGHSFDLFWFGLFALFYILQVTHLFFKVDGWTLLFILCCALIGYAYNTQNLSVQNTGPTTNQLLYGLVLILIALWTANRAAGPVANSDTALYHLASMEWNATYPIVKGLGNLHDRFAFNSSYFLYAALMDVGPWSGKSQHLLNGFLLTILLLQIAQSGRELLTPNRRVVRKSVFALLLIGPIITETLKGNIPSLSPDFAIFVLGIILGWQLLDYLSTPAAAPVQERFQLLCIATLSCLGITVKLSFLSLGLTSILIAFLYWSARHCSHKFTRLLISLWPIGLFCASFLGTWIVRGILLSGYPVYPMTFGALPVPWRIPRSLTISIDMWIRSWARQPWQPWPDVLQDWQWIHAWIKDVPPDLIKVLYVSGAALLFFAVTLFWRRNARLWILILPPLAGILFWFLSAPSFRFAGASFWLLAAVLLTLGIFNLLEDNVRWLRICTISLALAICIYVIPWQQPLLIYPTSAPILPAIPTPPTIAAQTNSGLTLQVPVAGQYACWRLIMCTPYFRPTLHAFDSQDVSQGFYLDPTFTYADINQSTLPPGITAPPDLGVAIIEQLIPGQLAPDSRSQLRLLVYSETATTVHALLHTSANADTLPEQNGQIVLRVNQNFYEFFLSPKNTTTKLDIPLQQDFNVVILELANGIFVLDTPNNSNSLTIFSHNPTFSNYIHRIEFIWQK